MCWGDVKLCQTSTGQEYLEFNERETKTRSGNDPRNVRAIAPKMFAVPNNEKCPVKAYKVYAEKRLNHAYDFRPNCTPLSSSTIIIYRFMSITTDQLCRLLITTSC